MYLRTVRAKGAEGVEFEYIRLVEAYWENGRSKQRVIANLGRKDLLAPHLENLVELLGGGKKTKTSPPSCGERIEPTVAACWGPMLVAWTSRQDLGHQHAALAADWALPQRRAGEFFIAFTIVLGGFQGWRLGVGMPKSSRHRANFCSRYRLAKKP